MLKGFFGPSKTEKQNQAFLVDFRNRIEEVSKLSDPLTRYWELLVQIDKLCSDEFREGFQKLPSHTRYAISQAYQKHDNRNDWGNFDPNLVFLGDVWGLWTKPLPEWKKVLAERGNDMVYLDRGPTIRSVIEEQANARTNLILEDLGKIFQDIPTK